jgi:DNA replication and repair protein RecF
LVNFFDENFIVSWDVDPIPGMKKLKITFDSKQSKISFFENDSKLTRPKYLETSKSVAVFFSPIEMNIIYLGPTLRRDFLDEVCSLYNPSFIKVRSDYQKILRNRNKLLKAINDWKATKQDLRFWDDNFIEKATLFYKYRLDFINFVKSNLNIVENFLEGKYKLSFDYITKVEVDDIEGSIRKYLTKNIDRDIIVGHTYIWPHLDDFVFNALFNEKSHNTQDCLSRWENKSILIWLKFLEIEYFKIRHHENIIILLDDIFSELDDEHMATVMDYCKNFTTFITAQNLPWFLLNEANVNRIYI